LEFDGGRKRIRGNYAELWCKVENVAEETSGHYTELGLVIATTGGGGRTGVVKRSVPVGLAKI